MFRVVEGCRAISQAALKYFTVSGDISNQILFIISLKELENIIFMYIFTSHSSKATADGGCGNIWRCVCPRNMGQFINHSATV